MTPMCRKLPFPGRIANDRFLNTCQTEILGKLGTCIPTPLLPLTAPLQIFRFPVFRGSRYPLEICVYTGNKPSRSIPQITPHPRLRHSPPLEPFRGPSPTPMPTQTVPLRTTLEHGRLGSFARNSVFAVLRGQQQASSGPVRFDSEISGVETR